MKRITVLAALSLAGLVACGGGDEPAPAKKGDKTLMEVGKKSGKRAGKSGGKADSKPEGKSEGKSGGKAKD